jgi:DNA-binding NarL/FixJ family response regulator
MNRQVSALIIAQPGQLRDGLYMLLKATPRVDVVIRAHVAPSTLDLGTLPCLSLIVVDADGEPSGMALDLLAQIKAQCPTARSITLVNSDAEHERCVAAGADVVLVKGVLATRLLTIIEELLSDTAA